jgi:CheY-specific phosphatase CheX
MRDMTEEEYDALDERLTNTVPTLGQTGTGFFTRKSSQVVCLDETTAVILNAKAIASRQTPSQVIAAMLRKELAAASAQG